MSNFDLLEGAESTGNSTIKIKNQKVISNIQVGVYGSATHKKVRDQLLSAIELAQAIGIQNSNRPTEPCNSGEDPEGWARVAEWEKRSE